MNHIFPRFFLIWLTPHLPKFWWMMAAPVCGCNCCKTLSEACSTPGVFIVLQQVELLFLTPVCEGFPPRQNISNTADDTDDLLSSTTLNHRNTINFKPIVAASLRTGALHPWSQNNQKPMIQYKSSTISTWGQTSQSALDSCPRFTHIQGGLCSDKQSSHLIFEVRQ